jgi:hypothetical protein
MFILVLDFTLNSTSELRTASNASLADVTSESALLVLNA